MSTTTLDLGRLWVWLRPIAPATRDVVVSSAVAGVGLDLVYRHGPATLVAAALVAFVAVAMLASRRVTNPQAIALVCAAPAFGMWLAVRTSIWLLPLDILAAGALLVLGASFARGGSVLDLSVPRAVLRGVQATLNGVLGAGFLRTAAVPRGGRVGPLLRGVAISLPLLFVCAALLASADAVFASAFRFDAGPILAHAIVIAAGAWAMAGLLRVASVPVADEAGVARPRLGATESTVILGGLNVLLAAFAVARVVAVSEGGRRVIRTAGLTYAEYARSGFFQLIAVAAITLATVIVLRATSDPDDTRARRRFVPLALVTIVLNVVVVASAVQRLALYERAFGLTMPRLLAMTVCVWLAIALVALGAGVAGVGGKRHWYWSAIGAAALVLLFGLNAMNAEAFVARHNVDARPTSGRFDAGYLTDLGDDAVPALAEALPRMDAATRAAVLRGLCDADRHGESWWAYNGSRDGATEARNDVCGRSSR